MLPTSESTLNIKVTHKSKNIVTWVFVFWCAWYCGCRGQYLSLSKAWYSIVNFTFGCARKSKLVSDYFAVSFPSLIIILLSYHTRISHVDVTGISSVSITGAQRHKIRS